MRQIYRWMIRMLLAIVACVGLVCAVQWFTLVREALDALMHSGEWQ